MKLILFLVLLFPSIAYQDATSLPRLTNKEIVQMVKAGLSPELIVGKIKKSRCNFDTDPLILAELKHKGVPNDVLQAMVEAPYGMPKLNKDSIKDSTPAKPPMAVVDWHSYEKACALLDSVGMVTRGFKDYGSGYFGCSTPYHEFKSAYPLPNNIAFYVTGDAQKAKQLKIILNVNNITEARDAHIALIGCSSILLSKAIGVDLKVEDEMLQALVLGKNGKWKSDQNQIEVVSELWPTGKGYEVNLIIM